MPSIIFGYEYDIFISYRQKDNKGDRWVSEFVEALKIELESTFKEEVSVYFDINPHDGLLETHDVDASLKKKLKCLIFIPIISRTYCDPKSFAWENEFKAFVESTSQDKFGLKIILSNGNVASRVLPVRIHDLDNNDIELCESLIGGVLRGVDFVYKSPGVNRPLRINEDHPTDNLNKTYYRDQINKVANAIDEIFRSLKRTGSIADKEKHLLQQSLSLNKAAVERAKKIFPLVFSKKTKTRIVLTLSFLLCAFCSILIYKFINRQEPITSLAILPFRCPENDMELISSGDMLAESALIKLHMLKSLTLRSPISTSQYRGTTKTVRTIRKELNVSYLVDGRIRRDSDKILIWVELVDTKGEKQLWAKEFSWANDQISGITGEITRNIAFWCNAEPSPEELKKIDSDPTKNNNAYLNYISANVISNDVFNSMTGSALTDSSGFRKAVSDYDNAIKYDPDFAQAYARRAIVIAWGYNTGHFNASYINKCHDDIDKALKINKDLTEAQIALGFYYYYCEIDYQKALVHFNRAAVKDPENYQPLFYMALVYRKTGGWDKSQNLISRVIRQNPQVALFLTNIGISYKYLHKYDSALIYHQKAIDIMPRWSAPYINKIETLILKDGKTSEARKVLEAATTNTGENLTDLRILLDIYEGKLKEALYETDHSVPGDFEIKAEKYLTFAKIYSLLNNPTAGAYYDSALVMLNAVNKVKRSFLIHSCKAIAYAGKGNKEKAIEEGKLSVVLTLKNKTDEIDMKIQQAAVYTMIGDYGNAIINIEYLLENPSSFSGRLLELDPVWKPLLEIAEVKTLIKKYTEEQKTETD